MCTKSLFKPQKKVIYTVQPRNNLALRLPASGPRPARVLRLLCLRLARKVPAFGPHLARVCVQATRGHPHLASGKLDAVPQYTRVNEQYRKIPNDTTLEANSLCCSSLHLRLIMMSQLQNKKHRLFWVYVVRLRLKKPAMLGLQARLGLGGFGFRFAFSPHLLQFLYTSRSDESNLGLTGQSFKKYIYGLEISCFCIYCICGN